MRAGLVYQYGTRWWSSSIVYRVVESAIGVVDNTFNLTFIEESNRMSRAKLARRFYSMMVFDQSNTSLGEMFATGTSIDCHFLACSSVANLVYSNLLIRFVSIILIFQASDLCIYLGLTPFDFFF